MIVIDGSQGEGGGQIFRTSLTLAICLGKSVTIKNIRAGRSKPGLLRQHLTCLRAAQSICDATIEGDALGSMTVVFHPAQVKPGTYRFAVGSAGSTTLVMQTILLPLLLSHSSSEIYLEGGTHNRHAPSFDFIESAFKPLIATMGFGLELEFDRYGFYPAGGGAWKMVTQPVTSLKPLALMERGPILKQWAVATSSRIPEHITERELAHVKKKLHWSDADLQQCLVASAGPGNMISLRVQSDTVTELFEVAGEKQLTAERVRRLKH